MGVATLVERLRPRISKQLTSHVAWNLVSFAVMGSAGLALNVLIASFYDRGTLGVFNQVYAVYILLSQVAVAGIHLSVLKYAAAESGRHDDILVGAMAATLLAAIPTTAIGYLASDFIGARMDSPDVATGLRVASLGVFFFAFNKVLLAFHNGLARMRGFAVFQALRFLLIIAFLLVLTALASAGPRLPLVFTLAEGVLLLALLAYTLRQHSVRITSRARVWVRRHFRFGRRALVGNLLADVNTRVDILMLGLLTSDAVVGVYSFAAMIAEGFSQLAIVFRNVVNPVLARYRVERTPQELEQKLRHGIGLAYRYTVPLAVLMVLAYPLAVRIFGLGEYMEAWKVFAILMTGIAAAMGYSTFQMLLNQAGFPGYQSVFFGLMFGTSVVLNAALIPMLGMVGAAIATAASFALSVVFLRTLVWRAMRVRM